MQHKLLILFRTTAPQDPDLGVLELRRATADDADAFARDIGTYESAAFAHRLTRGFRCYLAREDDHVLHSSWCSTVATWTEELRTYLAPPPGDAYIYESFTVEAARGRGIYPLVLRAISADLHREGIAGIWIGVESTNESSIRAITKAGFEHAYSFISEVEGPSVVVRADRHVAEGESLHIVSKPPQDGPSGA